ncbi:class E basic helix-loop-helix protein 22 [Pygocentrus nattereri]|uniref:class E basic helix-loop-helix protein 22 n=1 Tax=Pygocentrus nattereri TaxID=42514 RepID=UPI001891278F|nr:class E basic helix-loop-helix protein 22 [Pygocentrus nattereri]
MENGGGSKLPQGSQQSTCPAHSKGPETGGVSGRHWEDADHSVNPAADSPGSDSRGVRSLEGAHRRRGASERARALRVSINARERRRMHDLNEALDELRAAMPYRAGPTAKKLSKIATLLLARNHILLQARALEQMSRMVGQLKAGHYVSAGGDGQRGSLDNVI